MIKIVVKRKILLLSLIPKLTTEFKSASIVNCKGTRGDNKGDHAYVLQKIAAVL